MPVQTDILRKWRGYAGEPPEAEEPDETPDAPAPPQVDILGLWKGYAEEPVEPERPPAPIAPKSPDLIDIGGFGRWPERGLIPTAEALRSNAKTEQGADLIESLSGVMREAIEGGKLKKEDFEGGLVWYREFPDPFNPTNYRKLVDYAKSEADAKSKEVVGSGRPVRVKGEHLPTDFLLDLTDFSDIFKPLDAPTTPTETTDIFGKWAQMQGEFPQTFDEWKVEAKRRDERGKLEATWEFTKGAGQAVGDVLGDAWDWALDEAGPVVWGAFSGEKEAKKAFGRAPLKGWDEAQMYAKDVAGSIMDELGGYDQPEEWNREYQRYVRNFHVANHWEKLTASSPYAKTTKLGSFIANPINLAPFGVVAGPAGQIVRLGLRKGIKAGAAVGVVGAVGARMGTFGAAKVFGAPRILTEVALKKLGMEKAIPYLRGGYYTGAGAGVATGFPVLGQMAIAEGIMKTANVSAGAAQNVLKVFATPSGQMRFLQRLAMDKTIPSGLQRMATLAHKAKGTQLGDLAFNVVADGITAGTMMSAFSAAAGHTSAEELGGAFGMGLALGGAMGGIAGPKGAGKTTAGLTRTGEMTGRSKRDVSRFMETKLDNFTREKFKEFAPHMQVAAATNEMAGMTGVTMRLESGKNLLELHNKETRAKNEALAAKGEPPIALLDKAPAGWVNRETRTIFLNADTPGISSRVGMELLAHELGHVELLDIVSRDPGALQSFLKLYEDPKGEIFHIYDNAGKPIREVRLNKEAVAVHRDYNQRQKGIELGDDATLLMHEIFADQYSMAFSKDPNVFQTMNPNFKEMWANAVTAHVTNAIGRTLARLGIVDRMTGNVLQNPISRRLRKNPTIINLIKKYKQGRMWRGKMHRELMENGTKIKPKKGQTSAESYAETYGGEIVLSEREASHFKLKKQNDINELKSSVEEAAIEKAESIKAKEEAEVAAKESEIAAQEAEVAAKEAETTGAPDEVKQAAQVAARTAVKKKTEAQEKKTAADENARKKDFVGLGQGNGGRQLSERQKQLWSRGNATVRRGLDFLQGTIDRLQEITYGYRSGTTGDIYNPYWYRYFTAVGWEISPKNVTKRSKPNLKLVGWDNTVILNNIKVLIEEGFITKNKGEEFMLGFKEAAAKALRDPEGRINPLGLKENELMTAILAVDVVKKGEAQTVFGNQKLAEYVETQRTLPRSERDLQHAYRSFDASALLGADLSGRRGTGFDFKKVQNNYMPAFPEKPVTPRRPTGREERLFMPAGGRTLGLRDNITEDVLPAITQAKLSPQQLQAALAKTAGAKAYADEIGLTDFVKGRKSVTKEEVEVLGERLTELPEGWKVEKVPDSEYDLWHVVDEGGEQIGFATETAEKAISDVLRSDYLKGVHFDLQKTKFSEYQEPGGTNYREVKVKLPQTGLRKIDTTGWTAEKTSSGVRPSGEPYARVRWNVYDKEGVLIDNEKLAKSSADAIRDAANLLAKEKSTPFSDPTHFGDNVLLWLRLNDRIDANGKKVLFIEELQSNWHQTGRKKGYQGEGDNYKVVERDGKFYVYNKSLDRLDTRHVFDTRKYADQLVAMKNAKPLAERIDDARVPDAPFKKNWPALGLKYAVKEAIDGGYDRVAWLDGEGQAARYDLSKHVDEIRYAPQPDGNGYYISIVKGGDQIYGKMNQSLKSIEALVGKDIAKKIEAGEGNPTDRSMVQPGKSLAGLDLKVGGEGMKAFYDREMRSIASKISKKIKGGKVEKDFGVLRAEKGAGEPPNLAHGFDLPKDPAAVDNLRLYMPAERHPSDARPPEIMREMGRKRPETVPLPFIEDIGDKTPGEGFQRVVTAKKTRGEMDDFLRPEEIEGKNVSQVQPFQPRFPKRGGEKMFMPAMEAGAPKGKKVEAGRLWEKKGTDSPYFKKWFAKSKVVDEEGNPLVVYHGTKRDFTEFSAKYPDGLMFFSRNPEFASKWPEGIGGLREASPETKARADAINKRVKAKWEQEFKDRGLEKTKSDDPRREKWFDDYQADAAKEFAPFRNRFEMEEKADIRVMPVYLSVQKLFDPRKHFKIIEDFLKNKPEDAWILTGRDGAKAKSYIKEGNYLIYERKDVIDHLDSKGFDGVIISENTINPEYGTIAVWNNKQIKSATGNRGTFDPSDPNILHMPAGEGGRPPPRQVGQPRGGNAYFPMMGRPVGERRER